MKKILGIILAIVLIFVGGIGGFFIHAHVSKPKTYKLASAKEVINKVCKAADWLKEESETSAVESEIVSVNYVDYNDTTIDYNGKEDFAKFFLLILNSACENEINANVYYTSTAKYMVDSVEYGGEFNLLIQLTDNAAYFYLKDVQNNSSAVVEVRSEDNTKENCKIRVYVNGTFNALNGLTYIEICCDSNKVTQFAYCEIASDVNNLSDLTASKISDINVYDCNLAIAKKLNSYKASMTEQEIGNVISEVTDKFNSIKFVDVVCKRFNEIDFLKKAYKQLGYEVVE